MLKLTLIILAGFALQTTLANAKPGLDINDATVLFPNDTAHKPVPYLDLSNSILIDPNVVRQVIAQAILFELSAPQTAKIDTPQDWSVRGFRVDPCAPEEHGKGSEPCIFELRLIAQPLGRFSPADSAMHVIYRIASGRPAADNKLLQDLFQLKTDAENLSQSTSTGKALGIHPILDAALKANNSAIPQLFKDFLLKYAHKSRLSKLTMMGLRKGSPTDWVFFGGDIDSSGKWVLTNVPNRKNAAFTELNLQDNASPFKGSPIDPNFAMDSFFNQIEEFSPQDIDIIATRAFTLENPALSDRNKSDCLSCHTATTARLATEFEFPNFINGITSKPPAGITAFPALGTIQNHPLHWNLRAFGYFGLQATLNMRTLNEAAVAAADLNSILGLENPGIDCSAKSEEVMQCLIDGTINPNTVDDTQTCLLRCKE